MCDTCGCGQKPADNAVPVVPTQTVPPVAEPVVPPTVPVNPVEPVTPVVPPVEQPTVPPTGTPTV